MFSINKNMSAKESKETSPNMDFLLERNNLSYKVPKSYSLVNQRSKYQLRSISQNVLPGGTVTFNLSNSESYINPKTSYVYFNVSITGIANGAPLFHKEFASEKDYTGSVANLISSTRFIHSSGAEISKLESYSQLSLLRDKMFKGKKYWDPDGDHVIKGYNSRYITATPTQTYAIPLDELCSIFDSDQGSYATPFMTTGGTLEILLNSAAIAMCTAGASFTVNSAYILLDSLVLADSSQSALERLSASGNTEWSSSSWEVQKFNLSTANSCDINVNKSLGRVKQVLFGIYDNANLSNNDEDSNRPVPNSIGEYQFRVNNSSYPQLPSSTQIQTYLESTEGLYTTYTLSDQNGKYQYIRQDLSRNPSLPGISGLPINSSSALRLSATFHPDLSPMNKTVYVFLNYIQVSNPILYDRIDVLV